MSDIEQLRPEIESCLNRLRKMHLRVPKEIPPSLYSMMEQSMEKMLSSLDHDEDEDYELYQADPSGKARILFDFYYSISKSEDSIGAEYMKCVREYDAHINGE